jgi:hypothetical protein
MERIDHAAEARRLMSATDTKDWREDTTDLLDKKIDIVLAMRDEYKRHGQWRYVGDAARYECGAFLTMAKYSPIGDLERHRAAATYDVAYPLILDVVWEEAMAVAEKVAQEKRDKRDKSDYPASQYGNVLHSEMIGANDVLDALAWQRFALGADEGA